VRPGAMAVVLATALVGCAHSGSGRPLPEVDGKMVYVGEGGLRVEVLRLKGPSSECLLRVTGSKTAFDDYVLPCTWTKFGFEVIHEVAWHGFSWQLFSVRKDVQASLVTTRDETDYLRPDAALSAALDPAPLLRRYAEETETGVLDDLARFDRKVYVADQERAVATALAATNAACGTALTAQVDWTTAKDEALMKRPFINHVLGLVDFLGKLCTQAPGTKPWMVEHLKGLRFTLLPKDDGDPAEAMTLRDGVLTYGVRRGVNIEEAMVAAGGAVSAEPGEAASPWGDASTLLGRILLDSMQVCSDAQGRLVAMGPRVTVTGLHGYVTALFTGDREHLSRVRVIDGRMPGWFFDGRFPKPNAPVLLEGARLLDIPSHRFASGVEVVDGACKVTCGTRTAKVPLLSREDGIRALSSRAFTAPAFDRWPHALLRDDAGTYYFVDTSTLKDREKDFRVYVGTRGRMQKMALVNTLNDSAGELFSTKKGDLRLALERGPGSYWQEGKKRKALKLVPVEENLDVIFVELGVYAGQRLGNPCDDF
jgi:hypothetical protein